MLTHRTALGQIEITAGSKLLNVRVYAKETEQLHHEDKMKIGIAVLKVVEKRKGAVEESVERLVSAALAQREGEQFGKKQSNRGLYHIVLH